MSARRIDETAESTTGFKTPSDTASLDRTESQGVIRSARLHSVPNQRLFSVGAAARYLGISDDTLRKYADLSKIPVYRFINGNRAFKLEDLNRLIDELPMWNDRTSDTTRAGRDREVS